MRVLNEHEFPPNGGWTFRQPQTNWTNPMAMVGFKASIDAIRNHRLSNKAICIKHNLSTDPKVIGRELKMMATIRTGIPFEDPTPPSASFRSSSNQEQSGDNAVAAADIKTAAYGIKRAAQGTAVVLDWLTSGGQPVDQFLADKRASICASCVKNVPGAWYTTAPATLIHEALSARSDLKLETPFDSKLQSCDVCRCLLRLKVFCPLVHIVNHTKPEIMAEFPESCWIKNRDK